uniref:Platelet-derived growth factor (PDGF) family profile domain-containing protein n=1 Tax=Anabas testudineus TaxID=64144 RepID=A0A3Q1HI22_ANATE
MSCYKKCLPLLTLTVEAQPAQQAACKVRTEVMEVTRSMLDRRNADFMLWPPCVEVQRCSGCCNTRQLKCVPTVTSKRYLQVTKIQFINRKPHYEKAIISVEDHVSCRCQPASSSSTSSSLPIARSPIQSNPNPSSTSTSKLLEMVQREPDKHPHPHHRHQRPKPTTFKTGTAHQAVRKSV